MTKEFAMVTATTGITAFLICEHTIHSGYQDITMNTPTGRSLTVGNSRTILQYLLLFLFGGISVINSNRRSRSTYFIYEKTNAGKTLKDI